ncbi:MAG: T9SS type A sorting domain-containing protein, partial [Candidatus Cloacimonetes bacterium]|nr:T9SS type A sorting domain-containing protein [Candidatus Cloacimonadota bacterium]
HVVFNPEYGTVSPFGGTESIEVSFYSYDDTPGTVHTGQVIFRSQQNVPPVPVSICVVITDTFSTNQSCVENTYLYNNFPNPVINNTTFEFSLKEKSHVILSVYNLKGQLVATLLEEEFDPSSSHYVEWDGSVNGRKLASGIYFYKLETGNKSFLKKMVLMR